MNRIKNAVDEGNRLVAGELDRIGVDRGDRGSRASIYVPVAVRMPLTTPWRYHGRGSNDGVRDRQKKHTAVVRPAKSTRARAIRVRRRGHRSGGTKSTDVALPASGPLTPTVRGTRVAVMVPH